MASTTRFWHKSNPTCEWANLFAKALDGMNIKAMVSTLTAMSVGLQPATASAGGAVTSATAATEVKPEAAPNMEYKRCSSCILGLGALTGYYQPGQLNPGFLVSLLLLPLLLFHPGLGPAKVELNASAIKTGSTIQWQADLSPKEMTSSDMRNRCHVQLLLTWSKRCSSCIPGSGALTGYYQPGQLNPGFLTPCAAAPNMEYKRCSSCIPGLGALTGVLTAGPAEPSEIVLDQVDKLRKKEFSDHISNCLLLLLSYLHSVISGYQALTTIMTG
ncbi:hypothetical protein LAZ67_13003293 [Cordylochernes scorpioides]|uniref:Uncharacterized protein n=1 Tax=Cordylochernes scorpioides TaxID=51811 RepID=A0ABY6L571_9ARAC|nr:hypothetical protein LAZ67_13003293 [Cordylochernes scorpioides]